MHREICPVEIRVAINKKTTRFRNTGLKVKKRRKDDHTCSAMFIAPGENIAQALMLRLLQPFHRMLVTRHYSNNKWPSKSFEKARPNDSFKVAYELHARIDIVLTRITTIGK